MDITALSADAAGVAPAGQHAPIDASITFFYYRELGAATHFYEELLGLKATFAKKWVRIYQLTAASSVGLVLQDHGFHKAAPEKPVMLSIVTSDVDRWYNVLSAAGVRMRKELPGQKAGNDSGDALIRSFIAEDPGGYTIEFFSWLQSD